MNDKQDAPLAGIRTVELGDAWAAPYTATLLGDLAAEASRVETVRRRPAIVRGSPSDTAPHPMYPELDPGDDGWERHIFLHAVHHNKRSITLDLKDARGRGLMDRLLAISDVLVFNFRPAALERLDLSPEALRERHPQLVIAAVLGFGLESRYANYVSVGSTTDGYRGHSSLRGYAESGPLDNTAILHTDSVAALTATFAIQAALRQRERTGQGQIIDCSQAEATAAHFAHPIADCVWNGRIAGPRGNEHRCAAPHNTYRCIDVEGDERWVAIACFDDAQWAGLRTVLDDGRLADAAFATGLRRWKRRDEIDAVLDEWASTRDADAIAAALRAAGVPAQALLTADGVQAHTQVRARGFVATADHPSIGERAHTLPFFVFNGQRMPLERTASMLGQDNAYVLEELLGLSAAELSELEAEGLIGNRFLPAP